MADSEGATRQSELEARQAELQQRIAELERDIQQAEDGLRNGDDDEEISDDGAGGSRRAADGAGGDGGGGGGSSDSGAPPLKIVRLLTTYLSSRFSEYYFEFMRSSWKNQSVIKALGAFRLASNFVYMSDLELRLGTNIKTSGRRAPKGQCGVPPPSVINCVR